MKIPELIERRAKIAEVRRWSPYPFNSVNYSIEFAGVKPQPEDARRAQELARRLPDGSFEIEEPNDRGPGSHISQRFDNEEALVNYVWNRTALEYMKWLTPVGQPSEHRSFQNFWFNAVPARDRASDEQAKSGSVDELASLATHGELVVRQKVAFNPSTSPRTLIQLSKDREAVAYVAQNVGAPAELLAVLSKYPTPLVRLHVADNEKTPREVLDRLAHDEHTSVRVMVARNARTSPEVLSELSQNPTNAIRWNAASNPALPIADREFLASSNDFGVHWHLASVGGLSSVVDIERVIADENIALLEAQNSASARVLDSIARAWTYHKVADDVFRNANASPETIDFLTRHPTRTIASRLIGWDKPFHTVTPARINELIAHADKWVDTLLLDRDFCQPNTFDLHPGTAQLFLKSGDPRLELLAKLATGESEARLLELAGACGAQYLHVMSQRLHRPNGNHISEFDTRLRAARSEWMLLYGF